MQPVRYMVANGLTEFRTNSVYHDISPFSAMDGTILNSNDEFPETEEVFLEFSNASGKKKKKKGNFEKVFSYTPLGMAKAGVDSLTSEEAKGRREERRSKRAERRDQRKDFRQTKKESKLDRKSRRVGIKEQDSATQKAVAESLSQTSPEEAMLLNQISGGNNLKTADANQGQGMSKGMKIGLIVGGVVVLGVVSILVIRKMRKK